MNKGFQVTDDSGFIGLVNADRYNSFVKEDWEFNDLRDRFLSEMNRNNLLLWSTGQEGFWNVRVTTDDGTPESIKTLDARIEVTNGKLYLTNYEDLSMAAQFADEKIPQPHNANLVFELDNGLYHASVKQLFDVDNVDLDDSDQIHFQIVLRKISKESMNPNQFIKIPWT